MLRLVAYLMGGHLGGNKRDVMIRRVITYIIATTIVLVVGVFIYNFFTTGSIKITTNDPENIITLTPVSDDDDIKAKDAEIKQGKGSLSVTVHTGKYIASVDGGSIAITKIINLSSHKTIREYLNPQKTSAIEPVANEPGVNVSADDSSLVYVNSLNNTLNRISSSNNIIKLSDVKFKVIKWANPNFGFGQGVDNSFYIIKNGSVLKLSTPADVGDSNIVNFDVSPDEKIYFSWNGKIYKYSGKEFIEIYKSKTSHPNLIASVNGVIALDSSGDARAGNTEPIMAFIKNKGVKKQKIEAYTGSWSPSGKYLATSSDSGSNIYDDNLREVAVIPSQNINSPTWLNDYTLLYGIQDGLWSYNIQNQQAHKIANIPLAEPISEIQISHNKEYAYVVVGEEGTASIKRIGINNQTTPKVVLALQNLLPLTLSQSTIQLINFSGKPAVVVKPIPGIPQTNYQQEAQNELKLDGIDLNQIELRFGG
ncbi:hypothetical protein EPO04_03280 [Patescibacteria group bacterium]|nr:MAG: hypothetical protein EPO04_03280 [Patescibacteria group bacterium]